ncbi:MAG: lipoate--protein ligase family protein [Actinobacteria bacterium]|nr:lipoate--protein ligase family protein [Actinomycetota bacterium]
MTQQSSGEARWQLAISAPHSATANMALDVGMLDRAVARRNHLPLLRLYRWAGPALSLGSNQLLDPELERRCRQAGVELVRRPTGGSAVLHGGDLTYAVVAPYSGMSVMDAYRWVAQGLICGLGRLGLQAQVVRHRDSAAGPVLVIHGRGGAYGPGDACFAAPVGADLQVDGRKICGSAQKRRRGHFLQHGSIPLTDDRAMLAQLLDTEHPNHSTCLTSLRPGTTCEELQRCLVQGFEDAWGSYARLPDAALPLSEIKRKGSEKVVLA